MGFLIGLLTVVMVLNCIFLVFLILIQLPKKEAGAGLAFGGAATDALFGAGSGTVLTKITKYLATVFFVMAIVLSVMQSVHHRRPGAEFRRELNQAPAAATDIPRTAPAPAPVSPATPAAEAPAASPAVTPATPPPAGTTN